MHVRCSHTSLEIDVTYSWWQLELKWHSLNELARIVNKIFRLHEDFCNYWYLNVIAWVYACVGTTVLRARCSMFERNGNPLDAISFMKVKGMEMIIHHEDRTQLEITYISLLLTLAFTNSQTSLLNLKGYYLS